MLTTLLKMGILIFILLGIFSSCAEKEEVMNTNTSDVSTNIDQLKLRVNIPIEPQQVQWQIIAHHKDETRLPGGRYSLVALLDYAPDEIEQLKQLSGFAPHKRGFFTEKKDIQPWLPKEILEVITDVDDESVQFQVQGYNAEPFIQAGLGWKPGYWIHVEDTSQILLLLGMTN